MQRKSTIHGLHYSKCHSKPTPLKGKKIYKNSKEKEVRLQLVYIQRNLQVCQFGLCHKQMHICPYKAQLPEPTLQPELYKQQKNCPKLEPTKSFSFLPCLQRTETFHSAHQGEQSDFHYSQVRNATTLDAKNSADYIYLRTSPDRSPQEVLPLTPDPQEGTATVHTGHAAVLSSSGQRAG